MSQGKFQFLGENLNHGFQGYKLKIFSDHDDPMRYFPLKDPVQIDKARAGSTTTIFKILQSRASFNHLFPDAYLSNHAYYFTADGLLVLLKSENGKLDQKELLNLGFRDKAKLSGDTTEFPSLAFAAPDWLVVADGRGKLLLLEIAKDRQFCCVMFEFDHRELDGSGMVVLSAVRNPETGETKCLVYSAQENDGEVSSAPGSASRSSKVFYTVKLISFLPPQQSGQQLIVQVLATLRGAESPRVAFIEDNCAAFSVGGSEFTPLPSLIPGKGPSPSLAPSLSSVAAMEITTAHPPAYLWAQTSQDLTITVPLPQGTTKRSICCNLTTTTLKLSLAEFEHSLLEGTLFDGIQPSESVWTVEESKGSLVISLHLEKRNTLRWTHVFAVDDGVLETYDPKEFAAIQERMEKYTSTEPVNALESNVTSLQGNEECDELGDTFVMTQFDETGRLLQKSHTSQEWLCGSHSAGFLSKKKYRRTQVGLKMDVDCLIYEVKADLEVAHTGTFSAFGYVQASKRQKKFLTFTDNLEFAIIAESSRHVYVYRQPTPPGGQSADQYIYDLGVGEEILGICQLNHNTLAVLKNSAVFLLSLPS